MIPNQPGLSRNDDLRELIREVLMRRGVKPTKQIVEDIYILCVKTAANTQYQELRQIIIKTLESKM